jgi:hypothetical protein
MMSLSKQKDLRIIPTMNVLALTGDALEANASTSKEL